MELSLSYVVTENVLWSIGLDFFLMELTAELERQSILVPSSSK